MDMYALTCVVLKSKRHLSVIRNRNKKYEEKEEQLNN